MSNRDTFKYRIKDGNEIVYYGITNDLERREQEHRNEGMNFTSMEKIGNSESSQIMDRLTSFRITTLTSLREMSLCLMAQ